jgi:hypothetical protein
MQPALLRASCHPACQSNQQDAHKLLHPGKHNLMLLLIISSAIGIADSRGRTGAEKQNLAQSFVGVNSGRQRCGFEISRLQNSSHSGLNGVPSTCASATRIGRFSNADRKYIPGGSKGISIEQVHAKRLDSLITGSALNEAKKRSSKDL